MALELPEIPWRVCVEAAALNSSHQRMLKRRGFWALPPPGPVTAARSHPLILNTHRVHSRPCAGAQRLPPLSSPESPFSSKALLGCELNLTWLINTDNNKNLKGVNIYRILPTCHVSSHLILQCSGRLVLFLSLC